jgi:hypothetical protein
MSVDTTVVIAAHKREGRYSNSQWHFTAAVVGAAENLTDPLRPMDALEDATNIFLNTHKPWFTSLSRARRFATLLQEESKLYGGLEYLQIPVVKITEKGVFNWEFRNKYKRKAK